MNETASVLDVDARTTASAETTSEPRIRTAIAVIVTRFPRIDETYILREINELERHGQPVLVVPLLRGEGPVIHEEAKPWVKRALYTPLLSPAILHSCLLMFFRRPGAFLRLLVTLIVGTVLRPSTLIRTLALFPKSVHLARILPARGIKHVHSHFATHATSMAYIIAALSDITYSFTVHGPDVFVHRLLLREKIAKAKFVRTVSTFNKAFLSGLYPTLTEGKMEVVYSGVNPDVYEKAATEVEAEEPHHGGPLRLLSVAALIPHRGFPFLVDACARLARTGIPVECKIVGSGPLRPVTEAWIAQNGLTGKVQLVGNLPQHQVARLMGETDVFVLPSIIGMDGQMDGMPISIMEAMAAGKPVIASSLSGIPELVKHGINGILVDAAYAERLAEAVRTLNDDPELRRRLGRNGQNFVRRHFDVRRNAEKLVEVFDRYEQTNEPRKTTADRVAALNWSRLHASTLGIRKVHERPESFVAEVTISDGVSKQDVIVRQPRAHPDGVSPVERARTEFEVLSTLRQSMVAERFAETAGITYAVPRLLMFDEPNGAIVFERADGKSLAGLIADGKRLGRTGRLASGMRRAGAWLQAMQAHTRGGDDGRHVLTAIIVNALRDLDLACAGDRVLHWKRETVIQWLRDVEGRLAAQPMPVVGHHGDYCPDNIFIGDRRVDVIDFANYREGLPLEDVAQMLVYLEGAFDTPLQRRHVPKLHRAFLEGYSDGAPVEDEALRLFSVTSALRLLARGGEGERGTWWHRRALRNVIDRSLAPARA